MPRLPTFTANVQPGQVSGGRRAGPEDTGVVDLAPVARSLQQAGEQVLAGREEDESRKVLVKQAEIRAKYSKRLDEATTSGEDVDKIRQELDNDLSTVTEGLQTRKGVETAQLHSANTGAVFDSQANQIKVTRAAIEARVEGGKFLNSTGALVSSNPTYLPQAEQDVDAFVATLARLPPEKRAEIAADLKQNLNVTAAMANARLDPEATKRAVEGGAYNITPQQRQQVVNQADAEIRTRRVEENYKRAEEERQRREADDAARDRYFKDIMEGRGSRRALLDDPNLRPQTREHLVMFMEQRAKSLAGQERQSDPTVKRDLWLAIHAPDGDPRKIYNADKIFEAVQAGRLNPTDANQLNALVANQKDENNRSFGQRLQGRMQNIVGAMRSNPMYIAQPELASAVQNQMIADVERRAADLRKAGQSPDALLDPGSKDYFFTPNRLKQVEDDVRRQADATNPNVPRVTAPDDPQLRNLPDGAPFFDPQGIRRTMTPALRKALGEASPVGPTPGRPAERRPTNEEYQLWIQETGGRLKPGQTQQQAIEEWKRGSR